MTDREAFEACPDLQDYCDFSRCPDGTRRGIVVYNDPWTQGAWQGWQAALASERAKQAEPVALHIDHITPDDRKRYYDFEKYADHLPTCKQPRGDQSCECGYSAVRINLSDLLDELSAPAQQELKYVLASERAKPAEPVASMKRDLEKFRDVDNTECGRDWFISRVAWHLDRATPPAVQAEPSKDQYEQECSDIDAILTHLGLDIEQCRTDGGWLNVPKIKTLLQQAQESYERAKQSAATNVGIDWANPATLNGVLCHAAPDCDCTMAERMSGHKLECPLGPPEVDPMDVAPPAAPTFKLAGKADFHMSAEFDLPIGTDLYYAALPAVQGEPVERTTTALRCERCGSEQKIITYGARVPIAAPPADQEKRDRVK